MGTIKIIALILGIVLGSITILVALWISVKNKKFSANGLGVLVIGALLLGMSIWTSVKVKLPGDIVFEMESKLEETDRIINSIKEERDALLAELQRLETSINQISPTAIRPEQIQSFKNSITDIKTRNSSIEKYFTTLNSINEVTKVDLEELKKSTKFKPKKQQ